MIENALPCPVFLVKESRRRDRRDGQQRSISNLFCATARLKGRKIFIPESSWKCDTAMFRSAGFRAFSAFCAFCMFILGDEEGTNLFAELTSKEGSRARAQVNMR